MTATFRRIISPAPSTAWAGVLADDPAASVLQTPEWFDMVRRITRSADVSRLYEMPDGRQLILPLLRRSRVPGVAVDGAYPAGHGLGGLLASGGLRPSDVSSVLEDLLGSPALSTRITANPDLTAVWRAGRIPGVTDVSGHVEVLDLEGGFERVWNDRFRSSARQAVRKAVRAGLVVERDTSSRLVPTVYELHQQWTVRRARESGLPPRVAAYLARRRDPLEKFQAVAALPDDACRTWVAWLDGRPAAAVITLVWGRYAFYWRGYSDKRLAGPSRANNLLHRLAIEDACRAGCRTYNMGESGGVPELERFKRTFGATTEPALQFRIERLPLSRAQSLADRAQARALDRLRATRTP